MQIFSSARFRYDASRSASLKTATTSTPRSRQARMTRKAISPRLATRMRWNIVRLQIADCRLPIARQIGNRQSARGIHLEQHLPVLNRLLVLDGDLGNDAVALGLDLVE